MEENFGCGMLQLSKISWLTHSWKGCVQHEKIVGLIAVLLFCCIAGVDLNRMVNGLAFGWENILLGIVIAAVCWKYLLKNESGLLVSLMESAGLAVVIMCAGFVLSAFQGTDKDSDFIQDRNYNVENDYYAFDYDDYGYYGDDTPYAEEKAVDSVKCSWCNGSGICPECGGTGRNDATGVLAAVGCTLCDKTGRCAKCGGDGFLEVY